MHLQACWRFEIIFSPGHPAQSYVAGLARASQAAVLLPGLE